MRKCKIYLYYKDGSSYSFDFNHGSQSVDHIIDDFLKEVPQHYLENAKQITLRDGKRTRTRYLANAKAKSQ